MWAGELRRLADNRLDVESADNELRLLTEATQPNSQSTTLFAAISVMVGFLLALNAMLLTVPERRRFIADLRMQGFDSHQVLLLLGFQALALGVGASLVGLALGEVLSHTLLHQVPSYLTFAFPISAHLEVHASTVAVRPRVRPARRAARLATPGARSASRETPGRDLPRVGGRHRRSRDASPRGWEAPGSCWLRL